MCFYWRIFDGCCYRVMEFGLWGVVFFFGEFGVMVVLVFGDFGVFGIVVCNFRSGSGCVCVFWY